MREQLALVFEATGSGIWDHDLVTGRVFFSDSYLRILGHPPGTPRGSTSRCTAGGSGWNLKKVKAVASPSSSLALVKQSNQINSLFRLVLLTKIYDCFYNFLEVLLIRNTP